MDGRKVILPLPVQQRGGNEAKLPEYAGRLEKVLAARSGWHTLEAVRELPERFQLHSVAPGAA